MNKRDVTTLEYFHEVGAEKLDTRSLRILKDKFNAELTILDSLNLLTHRDFGDDVKQWTSAIQEIDAALAKRGIDNSG